MPLIGIIAKENDISFIKNEISKYSLKTKFEFVSINDKSLENIKNITFEALIINDRIEELIKTSNYLEDILKKTKYIILNSDFSGEIRELDNNSIKIITYGLNRKATITVSSIKEDKVLICVQRNIENVLNKIIEEQEFNINICKNNISKTYNMLAIFTVLCVYDEKI